MFLKNTLSIGLIKFKLNKWNIDNFVKILKKFPRAVDEYIYFVKQLGRVDEEKSFKSLLNPRDKLVNILF